MNDDMNGGVPIALGRISGDVSSGRIGGDISSPGDVPAWKMRPEPDTMPGLGYTKPEQDLGKQKWGYFFLGAAFGVALMGVLGLLLDMWI